MAKRTSEKSTLTLKTAASNLSSAILNTPMQSLLAKFMYVVLLIAFLVIGYLLGKVETLQKGATTAAVVPSQAGQTAPQQAPPAIKVTQDQVKSAFEKSIIKFGNSNSKYVVLETADPSCPYCNVAAGKNAELAKQMGPQFSSVADGGTYIAPVPELKKLLDSGKIAYAYIYYPGHGNGEMGMKAMWCANDNGKYWETHDLLMSNDGYNLMNTTVKNDKTQSQAMADFLKDAVDPATMKSCLDSGKYDKALADEAALARTLGTSGTPTYYINTEQQVGAQSFSAFKTALAIK